MRSCKHVRDLDPCPRVSFSDFTNSGDLEKLQKLVENKVDPNQGDYDKRTAVHLVISVSNLLSRNCFLTDLIYKAASEGHVKVIELLTSYKANVNPNDRYLTQTLMSRYFLCFF